MSKKRASINASKRRTFQFNMTDFGLNTQRRTSDRSFNLDSSNLNSSVFAELSNRFKDFISNNLTKYNPKENFHNFLKDLQLN